jgi:hypothetical protein
MHRSTKTHDPSEPASILLRRFAKADESKPLRGCPEKSIPDQGSLKSVSGATAANQNRIFSAVEKFLSGTGALCLSGSECLRPLNPQT